MDRGESIAGGVPSSDAEMANVASPPTTQPRAIAGYVFAAASASLIGAGVVRFAYTALLPSIIEAGWFSPSTVAYLGAANLTGYLLGATAARRLATWSNEVSVLRTMDVFAVLSLVACAFPVSFAWFFFWRVVSGIAGGTTMVLVAATILPHVPPARRGIVSGGVFLGIGVGMVASGTVVPLLLSHGIKAAWLGLATLCGVLTLLSWRSWPEICRTCPKLSPAPLHPLEPSARRLIRRMYLQFSLMALSLVPTMLFLVDYVARDLKLGTAAASWCWMACGLGAVIGPPLNGYVADKVGGRTAIGLAFLQQAIALALFSRAVSLSAALALSLAIGTFVSGSVPLILAWLRQELPNSVDRQNLVWTRSTYFFSSAQVLGGYVSSAALLATDGNHRPLFLGAACLFATAWALNVLHRAAPSSAS